jgi:hypothetical protein
MESRYFDGPSYVLNEMQKDVLSFYKLSFIQYGWFGTQLASEVLEEIYEETGPRFRHSYKSVTSMMCRLGNRYKREIA